MDSCTFSDGTWQTSSFCGPNGGNCVAVNLGVRGHVGIRDTKAASGPALVFDGVGWDAFLRMARFEGFEGG